MQAHSENHDVKLDTLSEPNAHLIEENVALPEDIFNSYWSYLLYEVFHYKRLTFLFLAIGILVFLIIFSHNLACVLVSVLLLIACFIIGLQIATSGGFFEPISHQDFILELLVEVIARKPAGKGWRTIAYNMNQYLFNERLWNTPYYFYSGRVCHDFFRTAVKRVQKVKDPILNPHALKAMKAEEEAQREYYKRQFPDADLP
ncbi:DUP/COS family protein SKDI_01G0840 [Saccharomyces kudriavzevii IFO 1802]|uniref:YAR028W-like protein n=1 Tax=Saccharomyces kudriavzevii (strain ATCC MYA-4449 / AS 2.2408 / CBS 8840 / NBRC 1802 / NCYC 2889) TaxID=226230 RepID=A0AA35JCU7_SACK1|nr:uncharacterized protein SKDI_01G0840 [Saccharomyces kudriavzevii IFO 1802]CAI4054658.1 hypothetical protein SKDI_01G0840 [Saccharomyces kudriavzevii IFO 1802]